MTRDDYLALLRRALSSPHGIALHRRRKRHLAVQARHRRPLRADKEAQQRREARTRTANPQMLMSKALCIELMNDALGAPVRFDCGRDVEHIRQRFYRARQWCQARGDYRFDGLKFQIDGSTLVINKRPIPAASQLRHKFKLLREMRAFVAKRGVGL